MSGMAKKNGIPPNLCRFCRRRISKGDGHWVKVGKGVGRAHKRCF